MRTPDKTLITFCLSVITCSLLLANINKDLPQQKQTPDIPGDGSGSVRLVEKGSNTGKGIFKSAQEDFGNAPYWNWVEQFGGSGNDYLEDVTTDSKSNVYAAGHFSGTVSIRDKNLICQGTRDAVVVKFDSMGNLLWINQFYSSPGQEIAAYEIFVGPDQNIYITGYYIGSVSIGGTIMPDNNWYNLFIAKLTPNGQVSMVKNHPTANNVEVGFDIDLDELGNIYVLAALNSSVANFRSPSVLLKYSPAGDIIWEQQHDERFSALEVADTSIYLAGTVTSVNDGSMDGYLDANVTVKLPYGYNDAFIAKADLAGNYKWASTAQHLDTLVGDSYSNHLLVDDNENIFMAGSYRSEVMFAGLSLTPVGFNDNFFAVCSPNGQYQMAISFDGQIRGIAIDEAGVPLVAKEAYLQTVIMDSMLARTVDSLPFPPRAIATFTDVLPEGNARYAVGYLGVNMAITKRDRSPKEDWSIEFLGNSGSGTIRGMITDDQGNLYVYGETQGRVGYFGKRVQGGMFLSKQNSSGNIIWFKEIPGLYMDNSTDNLLAISPDFQNIFITARFNSVIDIAGDAQLTPISGNNIFVAEYGIDGSFHWVYQGEFDGDILCLAPDYNGNVLLSGTFRDSIIIGTTQLNSTGLDDVFIASIDASGLPNWAKRAGGESTEYLGLVSTDNLNNVYLTGEFHSVNVTVDATPVTMNEGDGNILLSKLDADGNVLWVDVKAGSQIPGEDYGCWPTFIITDPLGNSYIKGWHGDSVYFDTILLTSPHATFSYFIGKFDPDGNTLWANSINEKQWGFDYNQMDIDGEGAVYLGAQAKDTLWFGSDYVYGNAGTIDLFVAKYKSGGELDWVKTILGSTGTSYIGSVAVADSNRIYVGGDMNDYLGFDDVDLVSENHHGFVAMLTGASLPVVSYSKKDVTEAGGNDGSIDITVKGGVPPFTYSWSNGASTQDIGRLVAGVYIINVTDVLDNKVSKSIEIEEPFDTGCYIAPDFIYDATDLLVEFSNNTIGVNNSYSWSFGDGSLSDQFNPSHIFTRAGVYDVCLSAYDSITRCLKELCQTIQVGSVVCYSEFKYYHDADTQSLIHFTSSVGGPVQSYYWMFGDGTVSTDPDPSHNFAGPGYYEVSLTVTDSTGNCMDQAIESIQIGAAECKGDFSYYIDSKTNTVYFSSKDLNDGLVYNWIFGDGTQSTLKEPKHTFKYPGFYTVSLSVYDDVSGCLNSKVETIQVGEGEDINADFIYQTQSVGTSVRFQDISIGKDLSYFWDFGDGSNSTKSNPVKDYSIGNYYNVCLNIYSSGGLQDIKCKSIFVGKDVTEDCQARFASLVDNTSKTATFTDKSFGSPNSWSWEFGDNSSAAVRYPKHTYAQDDYYIVHLLINNTITFCSDHTFGLVNIGMEGGLVARFGFVFHTQVKKADTYPVDFVAVSLGDAGKLKWTFGDGATDTTSLNPTHIYNGPGTYEVCLTLSNPNTNESNTYCQMIDVGPSSAGALEIGTALKCYPNPFNQISIIEFELAGSNMIDLSLYDLMGRKVKQLIREEKVSGRHQLELKGSEFESGHYYLILKTQDAIQRAIVTIAK